MTKQEYINHMKEIVKMSHGDPEAGHCMADALLMRLLSDLGYGDLVDLYEQVEKWYS